MARIDIIGLGNIGVHIANRLVQAGHSVVGRTRDGARKPGLDDGVETLAIDDQAEVWPSVMILCLPDETAIQSAVLHSGLLDQIASAGLVVDMGTSGVEAAHSLDKSCASRGLHCVDAPVSGGVGGAERGELTIFVGGPEETFHRAARILQECGTPHHMGPTGFGQAAKLANQIIVAGTIAAVTEGLHFANALGVDEQKLLTALSQGFADSCVMRVHGPRIASGEYGSNGPIRIHLKDLKLAETAAPSVFAELDLAKSVETTFSQLVAAGFANTDHSGYALRFKRGDLQ